MKITTSILQCGGIAIFLAVFAWTTGAYAAGNGSTDTIRNALETSTLSRSEQAAVQSKAEAALQAGVPADDVSIIVTRAVNRGADAGTISRLLDAGLAAKKEGLPVGPVTDRIEQGLSKGVPPDRIAAASERLVEKLRQAQPIVDGLVRGGLKQGHGNERNEAIQAAARALEQSIPAAAVEGMGSAVRSRQGSLRLFTRALDTAAYFTGSGMSPKTATQLVSHAVERGYSERDMDGMVRRVAAEMRRGLKAEDAASRMEREGMQGGRGMESQDMQREMMNKSGGGTAPGMGGMGGMGGPRR